MQTFIGAKLLLSKLAQPAIKPFEIYDSRLAGFTLRVQPTGIRSYYARLGRSRRIALGKVGALLPVIARSPCPCDTHTWRPTNGSRRWPSSMRSRSLRLPCAYSRNHFSTAPIVLPD